jgi:hypothetical protein
MRIIILVTLLLLTANAYSFDEILLEEDGELPGQGSVVLAEEFSLDVDGNGNADALSDGIILLRYLFGIRGEALTEGALGPNATRNFGDIEILLDQYGYSPY